MTPRLGSQLDQIDELTSLRGWAALAVLLYHAAPGVGELAIMGLDLRPMFSFGYAGVCFFFVLSGFVLSLRYREEMKIGGGYDLRRYMVARLARVYPAYLLCLVLMVPVFWYVHRAELEGDFMASSLVVHALALQAWVPNMTKLWNIPGWSISVELFFYLSLPIWLWLLGSCSRLQLAVIAGCAWLISLGISMLGNLLLSGALVQSAHSHAWMTFFEFNPLVRLPEFVIGVCLGVSWRRGQRSGGGLLALAGGGVGVGLFVITDKVFSGEFYLFLHNGLLAPAFALLIVGAARGIAWLRGGMWQRLGRWSYALYLSHAFVLAAFGYFTGRAWSETPGWLGLIGVVVAALAVGMALHHLCEEPGRRIVLAWWRSKEARR